MSSDPFNNGMPSMVMYGVSTVGDDLLRRMQERVVPTWVTTTTFPQIPQNATIAELEALTKRVESLEQAIVRQAARKRKAKR